MLSINSRSRSWPLGGAKDGVRTAAKAGPQPGRRFRGRLERMVGHNKGAKTFSSFLGHRHPARGHRRTLKLHQPRILQEPYRF